MTWVKLDDRYACHPKLIAAGPVALALDVAGMCYAAGYGTDGHIPATVLAALLPSAPLKDVRAAAARLVEVGRWEPVEGGGWQVHDFLDYNPSSSRAERIRQVRQAAGRQGGQASGRARRSKAEANASTNAEANGEANASSVASQVVEANPNPLPQPLPPTVSREGDPLEAEETSSSSNPPVEQARPGSGDVLRVFEAWKTSTGKHKARLDSRRRRKIEAALKAYPLEDVLAAVQGWQQSPHHRGENDRGTVYNELELLLRDAAHIERFRELHHGEGLTAAVVPMSREQRQMQETRARLEAWAREEASDHAGA